MNEQWCVVVIVKEDWDIRVFGPFDHRRAINKANSLEKKLKHVKSIGTFPLRRSQTDE